MYVLNAHHLLLILKEPKYLIQHILFWYGRSGKMTCLVSSLESAGSKPYIYM
jgi:hypothetical protein